MRHKRNDYNTSATQVQHKVWHKYYTNNTSATQVQHKCYTNDTSATWMSNFDSNNGSSENIISHLYISYMANERLLGEGQFHSLNYLLEMPCSHAKMKRAPKKLNFVMTNAISKSYTLDCSFKCSCMFLHGYA